MISAFSGTECIGLWVRSLFIPLSYILILFCLVIQVSLCVNIFYFCRMTVMEEAVEKYVYENKLI